MNNQQGLIHEYCSIYVELSDHLYCPSVLNSLMSCSWPFTWPANQFRIWFPHTFGYSRYVCHNCIDEFLFSKYGLFTLVLLPWNCNMFTFDREINHLERFIFFIWVSGKVHWGKREWPSEQDRYIDMTISCFPEKNVSSLLRWWPSFSP